MSEAFMVIIAIGILVSVLIAHMAQMAYMKGILDHFDEMFKESCERMKRIREELERR